MRVWTVANQKGGVGKTTTAAAIGGLFAERGARTLLIDMDPHASLSHYFKCDEARGNLHQVFTAAATLADVVQPTAFERLAILAAAPALATLDRNFGTRQGMGRVLSAALAEVRADFDRVVIDCPPLVGILMINAVAASERVLIPTQTEFLALRGLERMLETLAMVARSSGRTLPHHIIPTLYDGRTHASRSALEQLRSSFGARVTRSTIPTDTQIREASRAGVPAAAWRPARRGGSAYVELFDELAELEREAEAVA